jgi:flagellar biosynthesis protein FlhG
MDQASNLRKIIKSNQVNMQENSAQVITVTSGKGGVGKSNVTVNLAINFRRQGKRVIIFDADFGLANIEVIFGVVPKYNLFDIIYNNKDITDVLTAGPYGIDFISGGSGVQELFKFDQNQLSYLLKNLKKLDKLADIILIDTGAGISEIILDLISASSEVILVATPDPTSITDAYAVLKAIKKRGPNFEGKQLNVLINRVSSEKEGNDIYNKLSTVSNRFLEVKLNKIGFLPYDKLLEKSVIEQKPVSILYPKSNVSKAFEEIATNLLQGRLHEPNKQSGLGSVFSNLLRMKK